MTAKSLNQSSATVKALNRCKPCPFCGQHPNGFVVECSWGRVQCCIGGPEVRAGYNNMEEWCDAAVDEWNIRSDGK